MTTSTIEVSPYKASYTHAEIEAEFGPMSAQRVECRGGKVLLCRFFSNGYTFVGDDGEFMILGAGLDDETFSKPGLGMFNIAKAIRMIDRNRLRFPVLELPITPIMILHAKDLLTDPDVITKMTTKRRKEPLIYLEDREGGHHLIDGSHRLKRRINDRLQSIKIYLLDADEASTVIVQIYRLDHATWQRYDVMPEMFAGHL